MTFSADLKSGSIEALNQADCQLSIVKNFGFSIGAHFGNHGAFLVYCFVVVCLTLFFQKQGLKLS